MGTRDRIRALALIATVCVLVTGCTTTVAAPATESPSTLSVGPAAVRPELDRWLAWANELGYVLTLDDSPLGARGHEQPSADDSAVSDAIDGLSDEQLAALSSALEPGERVSVLSDLDAGPTSVREGVRSASVAMDLANWMWPRLRADQLERVHQNVPNLEPRGINNDLTSAYARTDGVAAAAPSVDDLAQGVADDCWLLAALGAAAQSQPQSISERMRVLPNGSYEVVLNNAGSELRVVVSPYFALDADGATLAFARSKERRVANWVSVFEKARAAAPDYGSYASLSGGSMLTDRMNSAAGGMETVFGDEAAAHQAGKLTVEVIAGWLADGRPVTVTTLIASLIGPAQTGESTLVDRHVYVVESASSRGVVLRNPWGAGASAPERVSIAWDELVRLRVVISSTAPRD